jgi:hypothetical protein
VPAPRHATGAHVSPDLLHILDRLTPALWYLTSANFWCRTRRSR